MLASTSTSALNPEDVWFVDSGASNRIIGDEAISAEVQATSLMMMNLCKSRNKIHRYGEREIYIGTKDVTTVTAIAIAITNYNNQP